MHMCIHLPGHICGDQRAALRHWFSPTIARAPGIEVKLLDFYSDCLPPLSSPPLSSSCQPPQKHYFPLGDRSGSLTALVTLSEDPVLVLSTHIGHLTTTCNSRSRVPDALLWPPQKPTHMWHIISETNTYTCMQIKIGLKILFQYAVHMKTRMFDFFILIFQTFCVSHKYSSSRCRLAVFQDLSGPK